MASLQPYTLKPPPSLQRIHSAKAQFKSGVHNSASNFSTVDVEQRAGLHKPSNLPLSRKSPAPQYQTVDVDEQMPTSSGQFNMKHPSSRFGDDSQMQQTLTFRKNK
jgi:redox-sensitive bicupin YhaK (pirin superfamily)